jgi:hypothetical protein
MQATSELLRAEPLPLSIVVLANEESGMQEPIRRCIESASGGRRGEN